MDIYVLVMLCFAATRAAGAMVSTDGGYAAGNFFAMVSFIVAVIFQSMAL